MQFGVFELDLDTRQLRKSGLRVRLQAKSFQILAALLDEPGKIVSREELRGRLWPRETFGAFDTGLNTAMNRLRLALGDSAENPRYIETVARTGYRFIAPVLQPPRAPIVEPVAAQSAAVLPRQQPSLNWMILWISAGLIAAILLAVALFWPRPTEATFRQITFHRGNIWGARFTPNGESVVYSADSDGRPRALFVTLPASPESRNLGHSGTGLASISRRGELALLTAGGTMNITGGTLARVPINGGAPVELGRNIMSADWSPDGKTLAVIRAVQGQNQIEYPIGKPLYHTPGSLGSLRIAGDGKALAFIEHPVRHDDAGAVVAIDTSGRVQGRSPDWGSASGLAWHPRTREIWFTASHSGSLRSVWAWRPGGRPPGLVACARSFARRVAGVIR